MVGLPKTFRCSRGENVCPEARVNITNTLMLMTRSTTVTVLERVMEFLVIVVSMAMLFRPSVSIRLIKVRTTEFNRIGLRHVVLAGAPRLTYPSLTMVVRSISGTVTMKTVCYGSMAAIVLLMAGLTVGVIATINELIFTRWLTPAWGDRLRTTPTTNGAVIFDLTFRTTCVITSSGKVRVKTTTSELTTVRTIVVRKTAPNAKCCPRNESTGTAVVMDKRQTAATYRMAVALIRNLCTKVGKSMATIALARTLTKVSELMVITVLTRWIGTPLPLSRRLGTCIF